MKIHISNPAIFFAVFFLSLSTVAQVTQSHIVVYRNNSYCLIDSNNKELIPSGRYSGIYPLYPHNGRFYRVTDSNNLKGVYSIAAIKLPCEYEDIDITGRFAKKNGKWAILNSDLQFVTDHIFTDYTGFYEGIAWVKKDKDVMLVDTMGRMVKTLPYPNVIKFEYYDVYRSIRLNDKYGYIDRLGNIIIPPEYDYVLYNLANISYGFVSTTFFPVRKNGKWGYVNAKNEVVLPMEYGYVSSIINGLGIVAKKSFFSDKDSIIGVVNAEGRLMFDDGRYERVGYAGSGRYWFRQNGKYGYLDSASFRIVVPAQYEFCNSFYMGGAVVKNKGFSAVIDTSGKIIFPFKYNEINPWEDIYIVSQQGKWGTVNRTGKILTPIEYYAIMPIVKNACIEKNGLRGVMNSEGKVIIPAVYNHIESMGKTMFYARKGYKYYFVYRNGVEKVL